MRVVEGIALVVLAGAAVIPAAGQTASPGYSLTQYADVPTPAHIFGAADGSLYVGNSDNATAGVFPHRVGPGGAPVTALSSTRIYDPDGVALDVDGTISGEAGSVITGSIGPGAGTIWAIRPSGAVEQLWSDPAWNVQEMVFDSTGRLLMSEPTTRTVLSTEGAFPTALFSTPAGVGAIAVDSADRIYTCADDGVVRVHSAAGVELDPSFATFSGQSYVDIGRGAGFGDDMYALDGGEGRIYRVDSAGQKTEIARGFDVAPSGDIRDIGFGADGALYIAYPAQNRIWRLTACEADCDGSGALDFFDFLCFQNLFAAGAPDADCDRSGSLDFFDFLCFQNAFAAGCA